MKDLHQLVSRPTRPGAALAGGLAAVLLALACVNAHAVNPCNPKNKFYDENLCNGADTGSGEQINLNCALAASSGDESSDTVKSDGYGVYVDGDEKVRCRTGGTAQPNLSGLGLDPKLKGGPPIRKMDLVLTGFIGPDGSDEPSPWLPASLFEEGPTWEDMEMAYMSVRPYRSEHNHIQLLASDATYEMAARFRVKPVDDHRYVINLADTVPDNPDDQFSGLLCHSFDSFWTNEAIAYQSDDVTAFLWPDKNDDGVADGYTVTTGVVTGVGDDNAYSLANPPTVTDAPRRAAICSQVGPVDCNGAGLGEFCNFLGFVDVQFTWHAENQ